MQRGWYGGLAGRFGRAASSDPLLNGGGGAWSLLCRLLWWLISGEDREWWFWFALTGARLGGTELEHSVLCCCVREAFSFWWNRDG